MSRKTLLWRHARTLRHNLTDAEKQLWQSLRQGALGFKFRRQFVIGEYIVDFTCVERLLIIEVDGGQHLDNSSDEQRDAWFRNQGYRVLRIWNNEVLSDREGVLQQIHLALHEELP